MDIENFFWQVELPQQKPQAEGVPFPVVLSPNPNNHPLDFFLDAIKAHKSWLESLLQKSGAILFKGFPVATPSDFNDVVEAFDFPELLYVGGRAPRTKVMGRVYTANESPPEINIPFHHEMAYLTDYPSKIFFFCEEEPGSRGETPIVLSHIVYEKMKEKHPKFVAQLEELGVMHINLISDKDDPSSLSGRGWKSTYMTDDKGVAEERAAKLGMKLEWIGDIAKATTYPIQAIRFDATSQKKTWFNSMAVYYKNHDPNTQVVLGNGETSPDNVEEDCLRILEEECVAIPWKKGDVLLVNNLLVLHGRRPILKPPRRILASLCK